jgi:hypothetical protein
MHCTAPSLPCNCCCCLQGFAPGLDVSSLPGLVDLSAGRYNSVMPQQPLGLQLGLSYAQMYGIRWAAVWALLCALVIVNVCCSRVYLRAGVWHQVGGSEAALSCSVLSGGSVA